MEADSGNLLRAAGKGNLEAYEELTAKYMKKVYNIILNRQMLHCDAAQLTQEVFVRVFRIISSVKNVNLLGTCILRTTQEVCSEAGVGLEKIC